MSVRPHRKQKTDKRYSTTWIIDYYDAQGKRHRLVHDSTEHEAREIERSIRIKKHAFKIPGAFPSLATAAPHFLEHYSLDHLPSGTKRTTQSIKLLLARLGSYQFPSITDQLVDWYKKERLGEGIKPSTINKELAALSSMCKWAHKKGYCERIKIERFPPKLTRAPIPTVPTRREMVKLMRAIPRKKRGIFAAMYYMGLRSSEARDMQPGHINHELGVAIITGKGNKQRVVPVNRKAWPYIRNGHLPFKAPKDLRGIIHWARKRADIKTHITPHLLRHAFGVHLTERGVSLRALQDLMGHSTSTVTEIYSRLAAEHLVKEMSKF